MIGWALPRALVELARAPARTFVSVATISLALAILALFLFTSENLRAGLDHFRSASRVVVFVPDADEGDVPRLRAELGAIPGVAEAIYYDRDAALARFRREWGELSREIVAAVGENPLPPFFELSLAPGEIDPGRIARAARAVEGAGDVEYGAETAERLARLAASAEAATIALGVFLSAFVFLIVLGAIRLAVDARIEEIEVLRIVGATDSFIRLPFALEGAMKGTLGAVFAVLLAEAFFRLLAWRVPETVFVFQRLSAEAAAGLVLLGASLGALGGLFAVRGVLAAPERVGN